MWFFKRLSKTFMTIDVRATGRLSFRQEGLLFLGTGMMIDFLKEVGTTEVARDSLNIEVNKPAS